MIPVSLAILPCLLYARIRSVCFPCNSQKEKPRLWSSSCCPLDFLGPSSGQSIRFFFYDYDDPSNVTSFSFVNVIMICVIRSYLTSSARSQFSLFLICCGTLEDLSAKHCFTLTKTNTPFCDLLACLLD